MPRRLDGRARTEIEKDPQNWLIDHALNGLLASKHAFALKLAS
jgi:hypothetical protein